MITIEEAIKRAGQTWNVNRTNTDADTAFQDRTLLAAEVVALTQSLLECEKEVERLTLELEPDGPPFD